MTVLEQRFMEQLPRVLRDLANEIAELRKEVAILNQQLREKGNE